jgi:hypothetical protein
MNPDISLAVGTSDAAALPLDNLVSIQFSENESENITYPEGKWYREFSTDDIEGMDSLKC